MQIHHIIPDELVQSTELGQAAQKAGYNLDKSENLIGLKNKANFDPTNDTVGHWSNHPEYTLQIKVRMNEVQEELVDKYKSLDKVPPKILLKRMSEIENQFRQLIKKGQIPTKDGRLSFVPNNPLLLGGRCEIRA